MSALKEKLMVVLFILFRIFPIKKNKIVVSCFSGKGYGDSPKAIAEELLHRKGPYDIVWLVNNMNEKFPAGVRKVKRLSAAAVYEQCTAKIWIDNRRKPGYVRKRKGQYYIQTWHGVRGMKKVEMDVADSLSPSYVKALVKDSKMADLFISASKLSSKGFRTSFLYNGEIMECGLPRLDVLLANDPEKKRQIKEKYGFRPEDKLVLYAPTFRKDAFDTDLSLYQLDWEGLLAEMDNHFGGTWKGLLRLHPNVAKLSAKMALPDNVKDVSACPDVEEFLLISDCVITDYSSTITDAGIAGKIGIIFAKDIEAYKKERDFYIPLEDFPYPIATSNEELLAIVRTFDEDAYQAERKRFFEGEDYGVFAGGNASAVVADRIDSVIAG